MKRLLTVTVIVRVVLGFLLLGCTPSSSETAPPQSQPQTQSSPLDSQVQPQTLTSPLTQSTPEPKTVVAPKPSSKDLATVSGLLFRGSTPQASEPMAGYRIYLARVIRADDGTPLMATVDEENSPSTVVEKDGSFVFVDVPSDLYSLSVYTPLGSYLLQTEEGKDLTFEAKPGVVTKLGRVFTNLPY